MINTDMVEGSTLEVQTNPEIMSVSPTNNSYLSDSLFSDVPQRAAQRRNTGFVVVVVVGGGGGGGGDDDELGQLI